MTDLWWSCKTCTVDGCDRKHCARGLCRPHYNAAKYAGTLGQYDTVRPETELQRLMRFVDTSAGPDTCWLWTGAVHKQSGYGQTYLWRDGRGVGMKASRAVYIAVHGDLPSDVHVLHSCDNPPCCNPTHLRAGSHLENMADRRRAGNYPRSPINHGTNGGYEMHRNRNEPIDADDSCGCRAAHAASARAKARRTA